MDRSRWNLMRSVPCKAREADLPVAHVRPGLLAAALQQVAIAVSPKLSERWCERNTAQLNLLAHARLMRLEQDDC